MNEHEYREPIFDLQFFAEGEAQQAAGGEPSNSGDAGAQGAQEAQPAQQEAARESEHTYTQADVDRIINQRFARFQREADRRVEQAREEARTEAERLAQMTEQQRAEHERQRAEQAAQQRESDLARREAEITRRELRAEAIDTLAQRGLPRALEQMLDYSGADACSASIDAVERVFRDAVQQGVEERLKQSGVQLQAAGKAPDYDSMSDADYYAARYKK
ncbi:MAG: DUF4355 domain-containing protein [Candidatus Ventricola sp.]